MNNNTLCLWIDRGLVQGENKRNKSHLQASSTFYFCFFWLGRLGGWTGSRSLTCGHKRSFILFSVVLMCWQVPASIITFLSLQVLFFCFCHLHGVNSQRYTMPRERRYILMCLNRDFFLNTALCEHLFKVQFQKCAFQKKTNKTKYPCKQPLNAALNRIYLNVCLNWLCSSSFSLCQSMTGKCCPPAMWITVRCRYFLFKPLQWVIWMSSMIFCLHQWIASNSL